MTKRKLVDDDKSILPEVLLSKDTKKELHKILIVDDE